MSIVSQSSMTADALSTILFVAGMEKGLQFLSGLPHAEAIVVDTDLKVTITRGLRGRFQYPLNNLGNVGRIANPPYIPPRILEMIRFQPAEDVEVTIVDERR